MYKEGIIRSLIDTLSWHFPEEPEQNNNNLSDELMSLGGDFSEIRNIPRGWHVYNSVNKCHAARYELVLPKYSPISINELLITWKKMNRNL
jgi:hypothetical protein